jgi:apolipoprotein N-acyltransferase
VAVRGQNNPNAADAPGAKLFFYALALGLSAILMSFAVESPRYWWLGWMTLLPLLQAARSLRPSLALAAGSFWGAVLFAASVTVAQTGVQPALFPLALLVLIPGLYAGFGAALTRRIGFSPYLMALGWVGVEFCLRPVGLEHGLLAGTQGNGVLIYTFGSFAGYFLVAFLVAYINASLLDVLHEVRGCLPVPRPIPVSSDVVRRVAVADVPFIASWVSRISQPRAPPV